MPDDQQIGTGVLRETRRELAQVRPRRGPDGVGIEVEEET
jgi:hypothetical protein